MVPRKEFSKKDQNHESVATTRTLLIHFFIQWIHFFIECGTSVTNVLILTWRRIFFPLNVEKYDVRNNKRKGW